MTAEPHQQREPAAAVAFAELLARAVGPDPDDTGVGSLWRTGQTERSHGTGSTKR